MDTIVVGIAAGFALMGSSALARPASGRVFSAMLERPGRWPWLFCAIEAMAAAALASRIGAA